MLPERELIKRIRRLARKVQYQEVIRGVGDDCAILHIPTRRQLLVTTDLCVEDVHFRRDWHPAPSVGHRCLARGLSDIAAMAGDPVACFLSLGIPAKLPEKWVDEFLEGLLKLTRLFQVPLAGGDTSSSEKITADIVVLGTVPAGKALLRSGARPGDRIYVTGELGGAAAVLKQLYAGKRVRPNHSSPYFYPVPRLKTARLIRQRSLASAMIDISDGLSVDLTHICQESKVSALIEASAIPVARAATLDLALHGGDDYELLFTAPKNLKLPAKIAGVPITPIGQILPHSASRSSIHIRDGSGRTKALNLQGWQHFVKAGQRFIKN